MMRYVYFVLVLVAIASCSTPSMQQTDSFGRTIEFSVIQQLNFGKTTQAEAEALIGKPNQIVDLKRDLLGQQAWIYMEGEGVQRRERLGLLIDKKTGTVISATWSPKEGEPLHQREAALSYFGGVGFTSKEVGWVAKHHYSDDAVYSHYHKGISLYVSGAAQTVQSISFGQPQQKELAQDQRK